MESSKQHIQYVALFVAVFSMSGVAVWLTLSRPATGYEVSIYAQYSPLFWVLLCGALIMAATSLFLSTYTNSYRWKSLAIILATYSMFLAIPDIRGYALYGRISDLQQHIGWTKAVFETGELTIYPGFHFLMAILNLFGVPFQNLRLIFAILPLSLWIVGIGLYTRRVTNSKTAATFAIFTAIPLALGEFHLQFQPAVKSFLVFPIAFVAIEEYANTSDRSALGLSLVFISGFVLLHPISGLLFATAVSVSAFASNVALNGQKYHEYPFLPAVAGSISIVMWLLYHGRGAKSISSVFIGALGSAGETAVKESASSSAGNGIVNMVLSYIGDVSLTTSQLAIRFFELYGVTVGFLLLAGFASLWAGLDWIMNRNRHWPGLHMNTQFVVGGVVAVAFLLLPLIVGSPVRVSRYVVLFGSILLGIWLWRTKSSNPGSHYREVAMVAIAVIVLLVLIPAGVMTSYEDNSHLTHSEEEGIQFVIEYHNSEKGVTTFLMDQRQVSYLAGSTYANRQWLFNRRAPTKPKGFPDHLGYPEQRVGDWIGSGYLITKQVDTRFVEYYFDSQRDRLTYYTEDDQERIESDRTVNSVYTNGNFTVWVVRND